MNSNAPPTGPTSRRPLRRWRQAYAVQTSQRLHDPHPGAAPSLDFLNDWLAERGVTLDDVVHREHADQIAANTTVRNIITSMRALSAFDWREFVEQVSLVEECLRGHGGHAVMDFLTRDRYRHAIEELARRSPHSELEIAQRVMAKVAALSDASNPREPCDDPGYYLIGAGRMGFEREAGFRPTLKQWCLRRCVAQAGPVYLGSIGALTLGLLAWPVAAGIEAGLGGFALFLIALCGAFPASDIATGLVNRLVLAWLPPRHLPRLELKSGVPESLRTCVVVPTLFVSETGVAEQVEQMEVRYLANPDGDISRG